MLSKSGAWFNRHDYLAKNQYSNKAIKKEKLRMKISFLLEAF